jgi:hypothetical protein
MSRYGALIQYIPQLKNGKLQSHLNCVVISSKMKYIENNVRLYMSVLLLLPLTLLRFLINM